MYRYLALLAILLLALTGCNKEKTTAHSTNGASMAHAIATAPVVVEPVVEVVPELVVEVVDAEPVVEQVAEEATTSILTVGLKNKFGEVFVPHKLHAELYYCYVCHGADKPGKIEKTKKEYHALCRKCHATLKAGPTKCRSCHHRE